MNDGDLQAIVTAELLWEPQVASDDIAVFAEDGVVTLRGSVGSAGEKRRAQIAAQRVAGIGAVSNNLLVRHTDVGRGAGAALRAVAWQTILLDGRIPRQRGG
ncbi:MAG TPA: BON domain-containing protein [Streptosporangiaceae bacterium]|nr:BON domain-containing protein [Streptosporangiaceae bacterium]